MGPCSSVHRFVGHVSVSLHHMQVWERQTKQTGKRTIRANRYTTHFTNCMGQI